VERGGIFGLFAAEVGLEEVIEVLVEFSIKPEKFLSVSISEIAVTYQIDHE
jgi:hypothetical protein